jgi:HlyD family secretion protein
MDLKEKGRRLREKLRSKKTAKILVAAAVVVALAAAGIISLTGRSATTNAEVVYQVASLKTGTLKKTVSGSGTLEAASETPVLAPVALSVTAVRIEEGQSVRSGDVVADIDVSTMYTAVSALRAEIDSLDRRIANLSSGSDSAETVKAPVSGRVKQVFVQPDDEVNDVLAQKGALLVISADGRLSFSFTPEKDAATPAVGEALRVTVQDAGTYDGTVQAIAPDKKTLTVTITDDGPKPGAKAAAFLNETELGSGDLAVNRPITLTAPGGTVKSVYVNENEKVYRGTSLLRIGNLPDSESYTGLTAQRAQKAEQLVYAQQIQDAGALVAPSDGIVTSSALKANLPVKAGASMFTLCSGSALSLKAAVDELDVVSVSEGQKAEITVDAVPGRKYGGNVESISRVGKAVNGVTTYGVNISVDGDDALRIGMNATADIVAEERAGVLMVPLAALQSRGAEQYVWVYTGQLPADPAEDPGKRTPVKTGLSNDTYAEVTNGLSANDKVVIVTVREDSGGTFMHRMNEMSGQHPNAAGENDGTAPSPD